MGSCASKQDLKVKPKPLEMDQISRYPRHGKLVIRSKNAQGKITSHLNMQFSLTEAIKLSSKTIEISGSKNPISSCVLPGLDPRGDCNKACQDNCIFIENQNSALLALFDGHGSDGEKVAQFCCKFIEKYYLKRFQESKDDILSFLVKLAENCDLEVKQTNLDLLYSGCTGVFVIIYEGIAYCASLGDSRAVLGTYSPPSVLPAPVVQKQQRKVLDEVRRRRESKVDDKIHPVQLTQDQKPDDPEEHSRIVASGGRVQRLLDANGQRIGPYRVWESTSNSPGLAMSRSIGDMIGKQIGVISTPVCTKYMINAEDDSFLVLASDGVWDVMDNEDVVNFVECFREKCKKGSLKPIPKGIDVVPSLTCIAHLLCEEARVRWYAVVEDEDVMIDDISCIILEFKKSENKTGYVPNKGTAVEEFKDREGEDSEDPRLLRKAPTVKEITTRDPRRGSIVSDKNLNY